MCWQGEVGVRGESSPRSVSTSRLRWDHANLSLCYSQSYNALQPLLKDIDENYSILCPPCRHHDSNSSCIKCIIRKNYIKDTIAAWYSK